MQVEINNTSLGNPKLVLRPAELVRWLSLVYYNQSIEFYALVRFPFQIRSDIMPQFMWTFLPPFPSNLLHFMPSLWEFSASVPLQEGLV